MSQLPQPKASILSIKPYVPGKTSRKSGGRPIKLSSNENPYGSNPAAMEAYRNAAASLHRYPNGGATEVRRAIGEAHGIDPERILCGAGSDELIGLLVNAYAGQGDEVLYPEHGFLMYKVYALAAGATPVAAPEKNLTTDVDALLAAVTPRTKIVFVANPNNPTGSYISASELRRLRDGLPSHVVLAVDAAYAEYAEELAGISPMGMGYSCGRDLALATENTVTLRTFSKIYGLPGLRLGWMAAPAGIIDALNRIRSPFNVSTPAQVAGIAAVKDNAWVRTHRALNAEGREWLSRELSALGLNPYPSVGNFVLFECGSPEKADRLVKKLGEREVYIRDVVAYGLPSCVRITVGTPEENQALVRAIQEIA